MQNKSTLSNVCIMQHGECEKGKEEKFIAKEKKEHKNAF